MEHEYKSNQRTKHGHCGVYRYLLQYSPLATSTGAINSDGNNGLRERRTPTEVHVDGVLVARTLIDLQKNTAALRVLNVTQAIRRGVDSS